MPIQSPAATGNAGQSNLISPKYGYDLVCATTQDAINATMKQWLSLYDGTEFTGCYAYDPVSKKTVETPLKTIVDAIGVDPFTLPDGADGTNPAVQKLYDTCKFQYAFRAKLGIAGMAPANIPDIIILNKGNEAVSYQLFCKEFEIINLANNFGTLAFANITQPPANPWIFLFEVNLDMRSGDQTPFSKLPQPVQNQVKNMDPGTMFSVQQLYLDLNTAGIQGYPQIEKLPPTSPAYIGLTQAFINQYWETLKNGSGGPLFGYVAKAVDPNLPTPSVVPTDLNIQVSPYLNSNGTESANYGLYTLNYLVMAKGATMPPATQFAWNWVDASEEGDFHGVMATRSDIFSSFIADLFTPELQALNYAATVSLTHSDETYHLQYGFAPVKGSPLAFVPTSPVPAPDADGFITVMTMNNAAQSPPSHDDSEASDHLSSIHGDYNYTLTGDIAFGRSVIRVRLHAVLYVQFNIHEAGIRYGKVDQNGVDYSIEASYQMVVTPDGKLQVVPTYHNVDNARPLSWDGGGLVDTSGVRDGVEAINASITSYLEGRMQGFETAIGSMLNGSNAWVQPGGGTFLFKQIEFSDNLDVLSHVTYAASTSVPAVVPLTPARALSAAR